MTTKETQQAFAPGHVTNSGENPVEALLNTYRHSPHRLNSEQIGKEDTLGEFIPNEILDQLREIGSAKGIRIYFGQYPENYTDFGIAGRRCLVFTTRFLKFSSGRVVVPSNIIALDSTGRIEKEMVETFLNTYRRTSHKENSQRIGKEDSSSIFLPIEILNQMGEAAVLKGATGVHANFGRYPDYYPNTELAGRQTIVFTIGDLLFSPDRFIIAKDVVAFFDVPVCPPLCCYCGLADCQPCRRSETRPSWFFGRNSPSISINA